MRTVCTYMAGKDHSILDDILEITTRLPGWLGKVFSHHAADEQLQSIRELSDAEFDRLVRLIFRQRSFSFNSESNPATCELIIEKDEAKVLVNYQHWRNAHIEATAIQQLLSSMNQYDIDSGIILCAGTFSQETRELAIKNNILLVNGDDLGKMLNDLLTAQTHSVTEKNTTEHNLKTYTEPDCPECGSPMIKRVAHRGKFAGRPFWGCSHYPECKGVLSIK